MALGYVARTAGRVVGDERGQGLGHLVANLLGRHPTAEASRKAQDALAADDPRAAMGAASEALGWVLSASQPEVPSDDAWAPRAWDGQAAAPGNNRLAEVLSDHGAAIDRLEEWIVPLAFGVTPRDLAGLRTSLPGVKSDGPHWAKHLGRPRIHAY